MRYTTLVFESDTPEKKAIVRKFAASELCTGWSMDEELLRVELIDKALEQNDIERAVEYINLVGVDSRKSDLEIEE